MIKKFIVFWTNKSGVRGDDFIFAIDAASARNAFEHCHPSYNVLSCCQV